MDANTLNEVSKDLLPGYLGIELLKLEPGYVEDEMPIKSFHLAPNGFLHAGGIITLADSACGHGCMGFLPEGASGFTTIEMKSNHLGTAREGSLYCEATALHRGSSTQVWDAVVMHRERDKKIAVFRCTQMILYPR